MMLESKNTNVVGKSAIVNRVGKMRHRIAPNVFLDDVPTHRVLEA